jgi:hypothetical protein
MSLTRRINAAVLMEIYRTMLARHFAYQLLPVIIALLCVALSWPVVAWAKADYLELGLGQGKGTLPDPQPDYQMTQVFVTFGHHADAWIKHRTGWNPPGDWDFRVTPYASFIDEPESNFELSCTLGLRISAPMGRLRPYVFGATGPIYSTQGVVEQSTRLNIGSFAGLGLEYRIDDHTAVSLFRSVRHYSNGSVETPNDGVDTATYGLTYMWYE